MAVRKTIVGLLMLVALGASMTACSTPARDGITLPLLSAWYDGKRVYYITTDVSEPKVAEIMGANLAPRLSDGLPSYPKPPTQKSLIERVYTFTNSPQDKVFSSAPAPIGPTSVDRHYSPVWLNVNVTWAPSAKQKILTSEEDILEQEDAHALTLDRTDVLLNCPIVGSEIGGFLPNTSRHSL